jgi:hypothetical protein
LGECCCFCTLVSFSFRLYYIYEIASVHTRVWLKLGLLWRSRDSKGHLIACLIKFGRTFKFAWCWCLCSNLLYSQQAGGSYTPKSRLPPSANTTLVQSGRQTREGVQILARPPARCFSSRPPHLGVRPAREFSFGFLVRFWFMCILCYVFKKDASFVACKLRTYPGCCFVPSLV